MVCGFYIVPLIDIIKFQIIYKVMVEDIIISLPRSMIRNVQCKNAPFHIDRYRYCCEAGLFWDPVN